GAMVVLPGAVLGKPYRAAIASLAGMPVGFAPAVLMGGAGTIPGGCIPGFGKTPGVGNAPGTPCGTNGLPGIAAAIGVANPLSLNVSTTGVPALTILTEFSLSSISNTWMSPCVSCSRKLRYCGFCVRLLGGGGTTSQAFFPDLSTVIPVNFTSDFCTGGVFVTGPITFGGFKPNGFRSTTTWYEL